MSTRSEILVKCSFGSCKLYHHHDGYIEGVGFDLFKRFFSKENEGFNKKNYAGNPMYPDVDDVVNELVKDEKDEYEVTLYIHSDIEYFYELDCDKGTLTGWKARYIDYDEKTGNRLNEDVLKKGVKYSHKEIEKMYKEWEEKRKQREEEENRHNTTARVQNAYPFG